MRKPSRASVGLLISRELVRRGYELIDDRESFAVRKRCSDQANVLVSVGPYEVLSPQGVKVEIVLGLQYPALQLLWNQCTEQRPEDPDESWAVLSAGSEKWCSDDVRLSWFYPVEKDIDTSPVTDVIVNSIECLGIPFCAGLEYISALTVVCSSDGDTQWTFDPAFILPLSLCIAGRCEEALAQAATFMKEFETASRRPNQMFLDSYGKLVANLSSRCRGS